MKQSRLYVYFYDLSVHYDSIDVDLVLYVHTYLLKSIIKKNIGFIKKMFIRLLSVCTAGIFNRSLVSKFQGPMKYVFLNNRPCQARPTLVEINSN